MDCRIKSGKDDRAVWVSSLGPWVKPEGDRERMASPHGARQLQAFSDSASTMAFTLCRSMVLSFTFDWLSNKEMVVFTLVIAGLWQGTGLTMALMLAGLRSIDDEIWKAARVDGIQMWRTYISIVIPMMRPVLVTTFVLSASGIVRIYDLVVALTQGGPGLFSEMPATYVMANLFGGNLAQGLAASSVMLVITAIVFVPWAIVEFGRGSGEQREPKVS